MAMDAKGRASVAVLGSGGREHALAWKLAQSPLVGRVFVLPGNGGMAPDTPLRFERKIHPVNIAATNAPAIIDFCRANDVSLVVPGPDRALVYGTAEEVALAGIPVFGPTARAAMLTEGSKCDAKEFMARHKIPTAPFRCFNPGEDPEVEAFIRSHLLPMVAKDDALADGKGVTIARSYEQALQAAFPLLAAGHRIVVEEFLPGRELSFTVLAVGRQYLPLALARDHKQFRGKMTGGMGAVSADDLVSLAMYREIIETIVEPTVIGLDEEGMPFIGFLYFGLMIGEHPSVLEINCRFGDPEAQAILVRLDSDLYLVLREALAGNLSELRLEWNPCPSVCVVLAAAGYPKEARKRDRISGIAAAYRVAGVHLFSAGTAISAAGKLVTAGGRVLNVVAVRPTRKLAQRSAYAAADRIRWAGKQLVRTIGQ